MNGLHSSLKLSQLKFNTLLEAEIWVKFLQFPEKDLLIYLSGKE